MTPEEKEKLLTEYVEKLKEFITMNRVSGRLKVAIDAHGDITYSTIPSASKRIVTQIWADFDDIREKMLKGGE